MTYKIKRIDNESFLFLSEDLHVDADDHADQLEEKPLDDGIALGIGDGVEDAAQQPDHTADDGGHHR